MRKTLGFADFTEFFFEQNYHNPNRCAKCGSEDLYLKIEIEQYIEGKPIARKVIPYCFRCGCIELL
jgi:hypothetical protein